MADPHHVVVDGSNLATEGRTLPSLAQLDEAVRTFSEEDPDSIITVVVDASFEHRVDEDERETLREAMLNGEVVSPPAGAIGRGDAFVLRIAQRTGAVVLSNDSFQEFHGEHPWLFDDGRLIGGKPVPGVGWIFTPRLPIRGPKSRAATAETKRRDPASAAAKAAELAKAAKKASKRSPAQADPPVDTSWPITPATPPPARAKADPALSHAIDDAVAEALHPPEPEAAEAAPTSKKKAAAAAKKAAKATKAAKKKESAPEKAAPAKKAAAKKAAAKKAPAKKVEAPSPPATAAAPSRPAGRAATPPPAVNEPLSFIHFVAAFKVGSTVEGEVVSFTSHGAMVDVALPDGGFLHCYIPLVAMGDPPPTKAREVMKKGEVRPFVLAGLDPPRRVAELSLPTPASAKKATPAPARAKKKRAPAKKAAKTSS